MKNLLIVLFILAVLSVSAQPRPQYLIPCGGVRGQEIEVKVTGNNLQTITDVLFYDEGLSLVKIIEAKPKALKMRLKIADNCQLGSHHIRLFGKANFSEVLIFTVGQFPVHTEKEDNGSIEKAEKIALNTTIDGIIKNEDIDYFSVDLKKGQELSAEVEINRLSHRRNGTQTASYFDTHISIVDKSGYILKDKDDTPLTKLDPHMQFIAPADGIYYLVIRSSEFSGHNDARYRLHVGNFPRPLAAYPAGGKPGENKEVSMILENGSNFKQTVKVPTKPGINFLQTKRGKLYSPTPILFQTDSAPSFLEKEKNDEKKDVKDFPAYPVTFDGIIEKPGDIDWWAFKAKKGANLRIAVHSHKIGCGLDSVLEIYNEKGQRRKLQDDSGSPDSVINYKAEYDGNFFVRIKDQLNGGKPHFVYRIQVTEKPKSISVSLPSASDNNQLGQEIRIHKGGKSIYQLLVNRDGSTGKDTLKIDNLPAGVFYKLLHAPQGKTKIPVLFEAKSDAPQSFKLSPVEISSENKLKGNLKQQIVMVKGRNNRPYAKYDADKLAIGVFDQTPFKISIDKQALPLPQLGYVQAKVKIERIGDFKGVVKVRLAYKIDGMSAIDQMTLKPDQKEILYTINANGGTPVGDWPVVFTAEAGHKGIDYILASSEHVIKVIPSFFNVKMSMQSFPQKDNGTLDIDLEHLQNFEGKVKVQLHGIPGGMTAKELTFGKNAKKISFPVTIAEKTRRGQHKNSFLALSIPYAGGYVKQNIRTNEAIRIDPLAQKPVVASSKAKPKTTQLKKLSRLEELRLKSKGGK
ncbi:MAG: hypothetical protein MK132_11130 [Lentisphaerales bacterium]|nr:hypothetical protein [Lentisphaerales bacterium]